MLAFAIWIFFSGSYNFVLVFIFRDCDLDAVPRVVEEAAHVPQVGNVLGLRVAIRVGGAHANFHNALFLGGFELNGVVTDIFSASFFKLQGVVYKVQAFLAIVPYFFRNWPLYLIEGRLPKDFAIFTHCTLQSARLCTLQRARLSTL